MKNYLIAILVPLFILFSACGTKEEKRAADIEAALYYISDGAEAEKASFPRDFHIQKTKFFDLRKEDFSPILEKNGFTFADFRDGANSNFLASINEVKTALELGNESSQLINKFNKAAEQTLKTWANQNLPSLKFDHVICTLTVYRSSNPNTLSKAHSSYPIAHIDFADSYYKKPVDLIDDLERAQLFVDRLGNSALDLVYWQDPKRLAKLLNIWVPLNDVVKNHHLGLIDITTLNHQRDSISYAASVPDQENNQRKVDFYSVGIKYKPDHHKWYYKSNMEFGEAIIFDTKHTAHASISPIEPFFERRSIETRCFFLKG